MGYQVVECTYRDGAREQMLALNATYLATSWQEVQKAAGGSRLLLETRLKSAAGGAMGREIVSLRVQRPTLAVREQVRKTADGPASDAPETESKPGTEFRRFSAFEHDLRVTPEGGLVAGAYTTTAADADAYIRTGEDAVRRYALANPVPACYEFVIRPPARTVIKEGVVQPANGQPGGGAEVIFVKGSPDKTVTRGRTLPER